jgi:RecA/RadA recombinase
VKMKNKLSLTDQISAQLNYNVFVKPGRLWLQIKAKGAKYLNGVLGSAKLGIPAGKLFHIAGKKHGGKSAEVAMLSGEAQRQHNAFVIWIDAENSFDFKWFKRLKVSTGGRDTDYNNDNFRLIYPKILVRDAVRNKKIGKKKKFEKGEIYLQSCEFLFKEAEEIMKVVKSIDKDRPIFLVVDSVAALRTEMAVTLGLADQNMRANSDRAIFLSNTLPEWTSLAKNYTAWIFFINQIRVKPGVMFGSPEYSPGGSALEHYCHVIALIRRKSGTKITHKGKKITKHISGYMINTKNKAGGGSEEGLLCSYDMDLLKGICSYGYLEAKKKEEK